MDCAAYLEAISADVDGEPHGIEPRIIEAHLSICESCRNFQRSLVVADPGGRPATHHTTRLAVAAERAARWPTTRVLLAVVAIQLIVLSSRDLFWPTATGAPLHDVRHLAAFTLAYGMLLVAVVIRPSRATAALPAATVLAGALAITAGVDLIAGRVPLAGEVLHIPEVLSVILIRILAPRNRPWSALRRLTTPFDGRGIHRRAG